MYAAFFTRHTAVAFNSLFEMLTNANWCEAVNDRLSILYLRCGAVALGVVALLRLFQFSI